ncbi:MAG: hypothetical protein ACLPQS_01350 [Acidimicrobiales bacterium]
MLAPTPPPSRTRAVVSVLAAAGLIVAVAFTVRAVDESGTGYAAAVYPSETLQLDFSGTAPIGHIYVHPGEHVNAGQILAVQDPPGLTGLVALADAAVLADEKRVAILQLATPGKAAASDQREVAGADAALATARYQLAEDQERLAQSALRAPAAGTVQAVDGAPGDLAGPSGVRATGSQPPVPNSEESGLSPAKGSVARGIPASGSDAVVTIRVGESWEVLARVPQASVSAVHPGLRGTFTFAALGGRTLPCTVVSVSSSPSDAGGQVAYEVILSVRSGLGRDVLPGMSGTLTLR